MSYHQIASSLDVANAPSPGGAASNRGYQASNDISIMDVN